MTAVLSTMGFEVEKVTNADQATMKAKIDEFVERVGTNPGAQLSLRLCRSCHDHSCWQDLRFSISVGTESPQGALTTLFRKPFPVVGRAVSARFLTIIP